MSELAGSKQQGPATERQGPEPRRSADFDEVGPFDPTPNDVVSDDPPRDDISRPVSHIIRLSTHNFRKEITRVLLYMLAGVLLVGAVAALAGPGPWERVSAYLNLVLSGLTALAASAVAFYFASQKNEDDSRRGDYRRPDEE